MASYLTLLSSTVKRDLWKYLHHRACEEWMRSGRRSATTVLGTPGNEWNTDKQENHNSFCPTFQSLCGPSIIYNRPSRTFWDHGNSQYGSHKPHIATGYFKHDGCNTENEILNFIWINLNLNCHVCSMATILDISYIYVCLCIYKHIWASGDLWIDTSLLCRREGLVFWANQGKCGIKYVLGWVWGGLPLGGNLGQVISPLCLSFVTYKSWLVDHCSRTPPSRAAEWAHGLCPALLQISGSTHWGSSVKGAPWSCATSQLASIPKYAGAWQGCFSRPSLWRPPARGFQATSECNLGRRERVPASGVQSDSLGLYCLDQWLNALPWSQPPETWCTCL